MPLDFDDRYLALWQLDDTIPDVFAYLAQCGPLSPAQQLAVVLADQGQRWQIDRAVSVEAYLARLPVLASDPDIKMQLAIGEFIARRSRGTVPDIEAFVSRFPDICETLRSRLTELLSFGRRTKWEEETVTQTIVRDTAPGDHRIGRYRVVRVLGEGAFGRVYLGFDEELQRQVAIKVPTAGRFQKPEDAEAYLAERAPSPVWIIRISFRCMMWDARPMARSTLSPS